MNILDKSMAGADAMGEALVRRMDHAADSAHELMGRASARGARLQEAERHLAANCRIHIRERPLTALGLAALGGLLIGWALRLR